MQPSKLRRLIIEMADRRGIDKTFCPSEIARQVATDEKTWRSLMPSVRRAVQTLEDRGLVRTLQKGKWIAVATAKGAVRIQKVADDRDHELPCLKLMNLGPASCEELDRVGINKLGDLRRMGATTAFETIMVDKLHRKEKQHLFHAMFLYALFGAVHDVNCMALPESVREFLRVEASRLRVEWTGK